jgi:hypothetical protein
VTMLERVLVGVLAVVLVAGGLFGYVLKREVDHIGDRADKALAKASQVSVRVDGLDNLKAEVLATATTVGQIATSIQAGIALDLSDVRAALDSLTSTLALVPSQVAAASQVAAQQFQAAVEAARGLLGDIRSALAPVGDLAGALGKPIDVSGRVDIHIVQPLVADLLDLLPQIVGALK